MKTRAESIRVMHPLFLVGEGGPTPTPALSAKSLTIERITLELAKDLNRAWHSRLPRFGTGSVTNQRLPCFGATHGGNVYAVAIWSKPQARELPQADWLELRRLATAPDAPKNTCTRMLRIMELLIRRQLPHVIRLISYQDTEVHTGAIYKAVGWTKTAVKSGAEWDCPSRSRPKAQSTADKQRWEKLLVTPGTPAAQTTRL